MFRLLILLVVCAAAPMAPQAKLTAEHVFISFGAPIRFSLVRGGVDGFAVNRWGFHPLSQLFADPI